MVVIVAEGHVDMAYFGCVYLLSDGCKHLEDLDLTVQVG
jgi:hypothetical protein